MIIWINGAFGAGKTGTAFELHRRIPGSFVYDPEEVGYFMRKRVPKQLAKPDFQDYAAWRACNYALIREIGSTFDGTLIIPMTIVESLYYDEIIGKLREDGLDVRHFALWASRETLQARLRKRGERQGSWAEAQIDRCITGLSDSRFEMRLDTDDMTLHEVVERIASETGITLQPDNRSAVAKWKDRWTTQIKHIRWFQ